jgi:hypothetical protein
MSQYPDMPFRQTGPETWTATIGGVPVTLTYEDWCKLRDALDDEWMFEMECALQEQADEADREEAAHQRACRAYNGWAA